MKAFDLELAKKGGAIQTADGRPAKIACYDMQYDNKKWLMCFVKEENGEEVPNFYYHNGDDINGDPDMKLVMAPVKKEGWINVYFYKDWNNGEIRFVSGVYETKEIAQESVESKTILATIKIEWEE